MLVIHDEDLSRQLEAIAATENRSVEDVIKSLLTHYSPETVSDSNMSTWWAAHIDELAFTTESPLDPDEADELLRSEFADHLWKQMTNGTATDPN
jgi:hypothetical protein